MTYLIKDATIANERTLTESSLFIRNGKIERIGKDIEVAEDAQVIDAKGCYLLPGVIDTHVHFRDGGDGNNSAGDFYTESRAALAGGVTSVIDMPNTSPQTTTLQALEAKERMAAEKSAVNYGFMMGATNDNIDSLLAIDPARYAAIKLFLGSSTGNMLVNDPVVLDHLFKDSKKLIVAHCEEESVVQANLKNFKLEFQGTEKESAELHPKIRNTEACYLSTYKAISRALLYGTRFHIAHISTATELNLLSNKSLPEKRITAEVTPNHLWFDDRDYATLGNRIKCNPAIKSNDDRLALWAALYDGLIDTIATDHAPHPIEKKNLPYFDAPSGIPSIQHSLQMMLEPLFSPLSVKPSAETKPKRENDHCEETNPTDDIVATWLPLIVEKMSHNPAILFGIKDRGFIRPGYWADLVIVRPCPQGSSVTLDSLCYKCGWSPLEGMSFHSSIERVMVNGGLTPMPLEFK